MIEETTCPKCGGPMQPRANGTTGQWFWGCKQYPKCKGTRNTDGDAPRPGYAGDVVGNDEESHLPSDRQRTNDDRRRW